MEVHNKFYERILVRFLLRLESIINLVNKKNNTKAAYMFLIIRDSDDLPGNIDLLSNMATSSIIHVLEEALFTAKNNKSKSVPKEKL